MAFCVNCGNQLNAGERFCTNCGTQVAAAPPRPVAPPAPPAPPPRAAQQETPPPTHSMGAAAGGMGVAAGGVMGGAMGGGTGGQPPQMQHAPMPQPSAQADPYHAPAPPQTPHQTGAHPSAESVKDMFFSYHGRLNRKRYILRALLVSVLMGLVNGVMGEMVESDSTVLHILSLLPLFVVLAGCVSSIMLAIRRWHDLGKSGWYNLLALIPLVNFFVTIYLWAKKGTEGPNVYGDDPLA